MFKMQLWEQILSWHTRMLLSRPWHNNNMCRSIPWLKEDVGRAVPGVIPPRESAKGNSRTPKLAFLLRRAVSREDPVCVPKWAQQWSWCWRHGQGCGKSGARSRQLESHQEMNEWWVPTWASYLFLTCENDAFGWWDPALRTLVPHHQLDNSTLLMLGCGIRDLCSWVG